ncbi:hypothetical protein LTS08_001187 [Lithohypha guttulata]|nr:hypothetical protein LTS08_001187 [Lithohypha guttulata]
MSRHPLNMDTFDIAEAPISVLSQALKDGLITGVELAAESLSRISHFDCRGPSLNSTPVLNPSIFNEAAASDERRARGEPTSPLDGIPCTVKDSYKIRGMSVASGSPALQDLIANEDSFVVQRLREAGSVILGKTVTCPMMYGGLQRGVHGRSENPYNKDWLSGAFASGSSHGSAVSTTSSMVAFGLGSETVSSGRSPASNNGLIAYTPSRGLISVRGIWPLYPTADDVCTHTRTMDDLFELLDVITAEDFTIQGDFWRSQNFVDVPTSWSSRPQPFKSLAKDTSLAGLRVAVPSCYVAGPQLAHVQPVFTSPAVVSLWEQARADLEAQGAEVIVVNEFPLVQGYDAPDSLSALGYSDFPRLPKDWNSVERGPLIALAWDAFLRGNADPKYPSLHAVDATKLFPAVPPDHPQIAYAEPTNAIHWTKLTSHLDRDVNSETAWQSLLNYPGLKDACRTLESMRKHFLEDWMTRNKYDVVVFPAAGDVGKADADISHESAKHAWTNGVKYSNCNRSFRHMGVPSVTVTMGLLEGKNVPMGLTFCGPAYSDEKLLGWAKAFESIRNRRQRPHLTPSLPRLSKLSKLKSNNERSPELSITNFAVKAAEKSTVDGQEQVTVNLGGSIKVNSPSSGDKTEVVVEVFLNGERIPDSDLNTKVPESDADQSSSLTFTFTASSQTPAPPQFDAREKTEATVARDQTMAMVLAWIVNKKTGTKSRPSGWYGLG